ncbi:ABC-three component system middle component 6 [Acinetobacter indicus]|uniref:ABC-three component system middle component 6 n=1 Tax=Acinetobacter indicus TaxID=756892 RepID=UPI000CEB868B|nr:ABC-three component system middle component 6 [Acinetobacter indicus]
MLPTKGCHPELNVLYIGGFILKKLYERKNKRMSISQLMKVGTKELSITVDYIILALDWLYIISAIGYNSKEVFINEIG